MKVYIISAPDHRAIYETWAECKAALGSVRGGRCQSVSSREKAEAMLYGCGVVLSTGVYAFTDGNAAGGVGIVFVEQGPEDVLSVERQSMSVHEVFEDADVPGLQSATEVSEALRQRRNVFAEMSAMYHVIRHSTPGSGFTIVHDYKGVAAWMEGLWKSDGGACDCGSGQRVPPVALGA